MLSRGPEEAIMIGEEVEVRVLEVRGDKVRLGIIAPGSVAVHRKEIFLSIQRENRAATASATAGIDGALEMLATRGPGPVRGGKTSGQAAEPAPASEESSTLSAVSPCFGVRQVPERMSVSDSQRQDTRGKTEAPGMIVVSSMAKPLRPLARR